MKERLAQAFRFGLVGVSGTVVNMAIAGLCILVGPTSATVLGGPVRFFHLYSVLAFTVAVIWNYHWNRRWTFTSQRRWWRGLLDFAAVSVVVQLAGLGLETWLVDRWGPGVPLTSDQWWYLAHALAILAMFPVAWLANRRWTFATRGHTQQP